MKVYVVFQTETDALADGWPNETANCMMDAEVVSVHATEESAKQALKAWFEENHNPEANGEALSEDGLSATCTLFNCADACRRILEKEVLA